MFGGSCAEQSASGATDRCESPRHRTMIRRKRFGPPRAARSDHVRASLRRLLSVAVAKPDPNQMQGCAQTGPMRVSSDGLSQRHTQTPAIAGVLRYRRKANVPLKSPLKSMTTKDACNTLRPTCLQGAFTPSYARSAPRGRFLKHWQCWSKLERAMRFELTTLTLAIFRSQQQSRKLLNSKCFRKALFPWLH
jgi:hypothetical protein